MKAMSHVPETSDRIATLEEVYQVMDLLGRITTGQGPVYSPILKFSLPLAGGEAPANTKGLWIDISEEKAGVQALDACPECLAALFANPSDLVN